MMVSLIPSIFKRLLGGKKVVSLLLVFKNRCARSSLLTPGPMMAVAEKRPPTTIMRETPIRYCRPSLRRQKPIGYLLYCTSEPDVRDLMSPDLAEETAFQVERDWMQS